MRNPSIWVRLLHRAVGIEDTHVVKERRVRILNNPASHNRIWKAASGRRSGSAESSYRDSDQEGGYKQSSPSGKEIDGFWFLCAAARDGIDAVSWLSISDRLELQWMAAS
jgi:hypothetical protein